MQLTELLRKYENEIIDESLESLERANLPHYPKSDPEENRNKLQHLFMLIIQSISTKRLTPMLEYSEKIAEERFKSGYALHEVHAAFNVLEETIWKKLVKHLQPEKLGEALGFVSTVLGSGKEALACKYVTLASKLKTPTLDLSALFSR